MQNEKKGIETGELTSDNRHMPVLKIRQTNEKGENRGKKKHLNPWIWDEPSERCPTFNFHYVCFFHSSLKIICSRSITVFI